jgi:N-acetylmuramoyl-L-alanine amidase
MRPFLVLLAAVLGLAAPASAHTAHVVQPGETLTGIAAAHGVSSAALAAASGLPADAMLITGTTISIPGPGQTLQQAAAGSGLPSAQKAASMYASSTTSSSADAPAPMGAYTVAVGDTLSGLAARAGVPVAQMAQMNGLAPDAMLIAGTALKLPTGAPVRSSAPPSTTPAAPSAGPAPTPARLDAARVSSLAAESGAPGSLAAAIAWQESGFNNSMVSSAGARGVMQVMPGTWQWVQDRLASRRLDAASADDNVRAGALYLAQLLRETGGDESMAIAGYYQGLASVRRIGMYDDTKRYVANVQALRSRFGG